ncbi:MAG: hypothetical protein P8J25_00025, partial [Porticoccaceae bacterium]|nr:hypothetical protein [Porticoccaceae bacterium]
DVASYTVEIPSQGANTFSSLIMYVVTQDVAVTMTDVVVSADSDTAEPVAPAVVTLAVGDAIDFESETAIESFGGTEGSLLDVDGNTVLNVVKNVDAADWAGNVIARGGYIFPLTATDSVMSAKVYSDAAATIRMKLELASDGGQSAEVDSTVAHGGAGWEVLEFDFAGTNAIDANFDVLVLFPNFGVVGAGATYQFDDVTFGASDTSGPTDNDGDGVLNADDAFPNDPNESVDTDEDGIGNNADTDDDNDGVEDNLDGDPLDPNVGELPKQQITVEGNPSAMLGQSVSVSINYDVSDNDSSLTGLGLGVHYDSSVLTFAEFANVLATDNISSSGPFNDDEDLDNDPSTDKYVSANWASLFGSWPGELPASLLTINFNTAEEVAGDTTTIGFSSVSNASGYAFAPTSYDMSILSGSWDFDRDGNADALTDGLMLLRYTFGLRGASLTDSAIASGSSLTPAEVEANVADSTTSFADIDGSGNVDALTDGLMLLRYLFGLRGESLIDAAVANGASRQSAAEIEAYIVSLMP